MSPIRFQVGDPVKARTSRLVPAGTRGTIQQLLRSVPDMYYVQFEGLAQPHLMYARDLQRIEDVMIVSCATIEAAAQVLAVLIQANLRLGRDFRIAAPRPSALLSWWICRPTCCASCVLSPTPLSREAARARESAR